MTHCLPFKMIDAAISAHFIWLPLTFLNKQVGCHTRSTSDLLVYNLQIPCIKANYRFLVFLRWHWNCWNAILHVTKMFINPKISSMSKIFKSRKFPICEIYSRRTEVEFGIFSSLIPFFRSSSGTLPRLGNSRLITEPFRRQFEISDHLKWNKTMMADVIRFP